MKRGAIAVLALAVAAAPGALAAQTPDAAAAAGADVASPLAKAVASNAAGRDPSNPPESITLEQAIERALEHNPQAVQAEGAVRTAEAAEKSARGAYLPRVSASASSSLSGSSRLGTTGGGSSLLEDPVDGAVPGVGTTGTRESYGAGVSASWDVYTGGRRGAEKAQAEAQSDAAAAGLVEQRFTVILTTKQAFYDVLRARELVDVAEARIETAEEGLAAARRRLDVGTATRSDVLRSELELNTARESLLEARNSHRAATYQLGRLIGAEGAVDVTPPASIDPEPLGVSAGDLTASLLDDAPMVRSAEAALRAADAGIDAAHSQYLPTVSLNTGYDWSSDELGFDGSRTGWRVGVGVSIPIFDGYQRAESGERARVQEEVAAAQLADTRRAIGAEVERLVGNLHLAEERIALKTEAVQVAEEDLRVQQDRYRLGASTILDLLTSQTALVQAQTELVSARYDYQLARAELEALAGREI